MDLDEALISRAHQALGCSTVRATIEEALRRAIDHERYRATQIEFLVDLPSLVDRDVLKAGAMWR